MQILTNPNVRPQLLIVTAAALALVVVCLFNLPIGPSHFNAPAVATVNTSEVARLNLQLNNSSDPVDRANSALRLSTIATRQLENGVTATSPGTSPAAIQGRLNQALASETDANTRATIISAITRIRNHEIMESTLNPLTQRFK